MSTEDLHIDVRNLAPPEPLEHCLAALSQLAKGQQLHMSIDREPFPLYDILTRNGFEYCCTFEQTHYLVTIWHR